MIRPSMQWLTAPTLTACAALAVFCQPAPAAPSMHERLVALTQTYVDAIAKDDPVGGTYLGLPGSDSRWPRPSEAARAERIERLQGWKAQLDAIANDGGLAAALADRDDARLLRAGFDAELNEAQVRRSDRKSFAEPSLRVVGALFTQLLRLPLVGQDGATARDVERAWDDITARLEQAPAYIAAAEALVTEPGRLQGTVGMQQLEGAPELLNGPLTVAATEQLKARPDVLKRFIVGRDATLAAVAEARATIEARVASWPENHAIGKAAYEQMLRDEQLLPFDAADIERMARDELAHGWAEEAWLVSVSKQRKSPFGPESGGGMAPGGPALVGYYRDRIAELTRFMREHDVVTVPDWLGKMEIVETPAFMQPVSPGASMFSPRRFSTSTTGYYLITPPVSLEDAALRLDMNQDFDRDRIWSTAAHEAMPGHFLQLSIAKRHPDLVRRIQSSSVLAEGWAFYGEEMLVRLGLYGDDIDPRLFTARWERVRGARAIVDPKLATGEWTIPQAVEFFEAQSGFTHGAAQAAVNGIALGPGYVISYTVGRFQLQSLLGEYVRRKGDSGSLRDFHDRLLSYGSVPFSVIAPELIADLDKPGAAVRAAANY